MAQHRVPESSQYRGEWVVASELLSQQKPRRWQRVFGGLCWASLAPFCVLQKARCAEIWIGTWRPSTGTVVSDLNWETGWETGWECGGGVVLDVTDSCSCCPWPWLADSWCCGTWCHPGASWRVEIKTSNILHEIMPKSWQRHKERFRSISVAWALPCRRESFPWIPVLGPLQHRLHCYLRLLNSWAGAPRSP